MKSLMCARILAALALVCLTSPAATQPQADAISALVARVEAAARGGNAAAFRELAQEEKAVEDLVAWFAAPSASRIVVKERDRTELEPTRRRLLLETFSEYGAEARLATFSVDLVRSGDSWKIASSVRVNNVIGLYRLSVNRVKHFEIRNLTVEAPDLTLHLASGSAFVAETTEGPTAVILLGHGEMRFSPPDPAERTQLRIFSGDPIIKTPFEGAFIRVRPSDFAARFPAAALIPRTVSLTELRRAEDIFEEYIGKTLQIDLSDLSRDRWSITPQADDVIAEIRTQKLGSLTYTRSTQDQEDITLFDRRRRKNISVYASAEKLAARGRFYSEDDLLDYDIVALDIDTKVTPERTFIEGTARIKVRITAGGTQTLNLRLAESLAVRGVYSPQFGRLLHLRVVGQNSLIVSLPATAVRGTELWLSVVYAGRVQPQELDREAIAMEQDPESGSMPPEPRLLYSHRAYWYPQSTVSDYATVKLAITVPQDYDVIATGAPQGEPAPPPGVADPGQRGRRMFVFESERPVRYLAFVISRFRAVSSRQIDDVDMMVAATPRQAGRARGMSGRAEEIFSFYKSLVGRAPYPSFTVAFTERESPGGHSPAYFAVVDQVVRTGNITWRSDPVNFEDYPAFFVAHEVAHQWWGQAVGWKNYHEQWLSEGFAQYFAMLYAEKKLSGGVADNVVRQMRQTAIAQSSQGPVYLGYRLGHIKGQTPVFRAIVYNKAAMVLHMLRRVVGDDAFFKGVRDFYDTWEFKKAGTGDFQAAMEKASGKQLGRFFDAWIFGEAIPRIKFNQRVDNDHAVVHFEQEGEPVDVPVTVTVTYSSGETVDVVVRVGEKSVDQRIPLKGPVRSIQANSDNGALVTIIR